MDPGNECPEGQPNPMVSWRGRPVSINQGACPVRPQKPDRTGLHPSFIEQLRLTRHFFRRSIHQALGEPSQLDSRDASQPRASAAVAPHPGVPASQEAGPSRFKGRLLQKLSLLIILRIVSRQTFTSKFHLAAATLYWLASTVDVDSRRCGPPYRGTTGSCQTLSTPPRLRPAGGLPPLQATCELR